MRTISLGSILLLLLSACTRGPDNTVIQQEITSRLNNEFADGLFEVNKLSRRGSSPNPTGEGVFIYYDAALEFKRDYNLTAWQGLNLGTLAVVLGATPAGIDGFSSAGNTRGDILNIRGRLNYVDTEGTWTNVDLVSIKPEGPTMPKQFEGRGPVAVLKSVRELVARTSAHEAKSHDQAVINEFNQALARIDLKFASLEGKLSFGTGWPAGTYNKFGIAFADYAVKREFPIFNYSSEGSIENGLHLQSGLLDFALLQSDVAEVLYKGWLAERQIPQPDLRSMASLWPEALHIVTFVDSGIKTFADLHGKRIAIGSTNSGTRFTAVRVWKASGLPAQEISNIREIGLGASIAALEQGEVDAIFVAGAIPDPAIQALSQRRQDVMFVPIEQSTLNKLTTDHFAYYGNSIPEKTYPGQHGPYRTLGFAALLLTNRTTSEEDVLQFLGFLIASTSDISKDFYHAGFITPNTARLGMSVPMHAGAEKFFAAHQENIPSISE
jgi:TRAP transporter TAXI family solute receptor